MTPLGTYDEVATLLRLSRRTVYQMTYQKRFPAGVYLGKGRFNMDKLEKHLLEGSLYQQAEWSIRERRYLHTA